MKYLSWSIAIALVFALSACGGQPSTPTPDVMATANAAASTMIAETQAALPTDTPIPPTEAPTDTPEPSPTIPPIPSVPALASPTAAASNPGGECSGPIQRSKGDTAATFLINNKTAQVVTVSMQLKKNSFGDCGYWSTVISPHASYSNTNLPLGCYNVYSFNQTGKPDFQNGYFGLCTGFNTDKFTINLTIQTIGVVAP